MTSFTLLKSDWKWIEYVQKSHYPQERQGVSHRFWTANMFVRQLKIFLDPNNVVRRGEGLRIAPISENPEFPILSPQNMATRKEW